MIEFIEANMTYILLFLIFLVWLRTVLIIWDIKRLRRTLRDSIMRISEIGSKSPGRRI